MAITQMPSRDPVPRGQPSHRAPGSELYDPNHWEAAYRPAAPVAPPVLLIQLEDDLARSRLREAFWISVVIHIVVVLVIINSPALERFLPHRPVLVVAPSDWLRQKELTYLELPPDVQKITRRPNDNVISDRDRIASHRAELDPKELKQILDSARPGPPGPSVTPAQATPPATQAAAQSNPSPQEQPQPPRNQLAQLQPPVMPKPTFGGPVSAGTAIAEAARAANPSRGGYSGGGGDYGLSQGQQPGQAASNLDVLSDTMGVDFGPYLSRIIHDVRMNWYNLIPEVARSPIMKKGKVSIEFAILKDGRVAGMRLTTTSSDVSLDRAAWGGITASNPFPPLPQEFQGQYLALRFHFYYNLDRNELQ